MPKKPLGFPEQTSDLIKGGWLLGRLIWQLCAERHGRERVKTGGPVRELLRKPRE